MESIFSLLDVELSLHRDERGDDELEISKILA